ncbi:hypothetical protein HPB50_009326 [Hyalomma asiaticum]|uniref:Uncharacterized protein n=1 Tax=Hyalomma asiaticum TaxID=266040 RepID=A0ACB7S1Q2_HYAAI|nr:hypothetical protein HPB50_009326 [Hyalomma asiaticum]
MRGKGVSCHAEQNSDVTSSSSGGGGGNTASPPAPAEVARRGKHALFDGATTGDETAGPGIGDAFLDFCDKRELTDGVRAPGIPAREATTPAPLSNLSTWTKVSRGSDESSSCNALGRYMDYGRRLTCVASRRFRATPGHGDKQTSSLVEGRLVQIGENAAELGMAVTRI